MVRVPPEISKKSRELTSDMVFTVAWEDVKGSIVGDPENCAAARALKRIAGITRAWVASRVTYLVYVDATVLRCQNKGRLPNTVNGYDKSAGLFPPGDYLLGPFPKTQTLKGMQDYKTQHGREPKRKGIRSDKGTPRKGSIALR